MSTPNSINQGIYPAFETETPQGAQNSGKNFESPVNHGIIDESLIKKEHVDVHKERLQSLRKELDYLKSTDWKFESDRGFAQ